MKFSRKVGRCLTISTNRALRSGSWSQKVWGSGWLDERTENEHRFLQLAISSISCDSFRWNGIVSPSSRPIIRLLMLLNFSDRSHGIRLRNAVETS